MKGRYSGEEGVGVENGQLLQGDYSGLGLGLVGVGWGYCFVVAVVVCGFVFGVACVCHYHH